MTEKTGVPQIDDDPVIWLLWTGQAKTLHEAEEMYLDASLPEVYRLLASDIPDDELVKHPLLVMMRSTAAAVGRTRCCELRASTGVQPASPLHLALVEIVRRQYEVACKAADQADKEAIRTAQGTK